MLFTLTDLGKIGGLIVLAAIGLYLLTKWWRRRLFIRQLRMDRITVAELRKLIDDSQEIVILDVRRRRFERRKAPFRARFLRIQRISILP
jgi:hypothetical protein